MSRANSHRSPVESVARLPHTPFTGLQDRSFSKRISCDITNLKNMTTAISKYFLFPVCFLFLIHNYALASMPLTSQIAFSGMGICVAIPGEAWTRTTIIFSACRGFYVYPKDESVAQFTYVQADSTSSAEGQTRHSGQWCAGTTASFGQTISI